MKGIFKMTLSERLEAKSVPVPECGCIIWVGGCSYYGYGEMNYNHKICNVHRLSWEIHKGKIPDGVHVLHKCDVPPCINSDHLYLGTAKDNANDRERRNRGNHVPLKGSLNGNSKLNEEDIFRIREDRRSQRKIAADYGVEKTTIGHIKQRKTWNHI